MIDIDENHAVAVYEFIPKEIGTVEGRVRRHYRYTSKRSRG